MRGARSVHAPEAQKLPVLSVEKDWATSGALPPRIAATILSSLMPPMVLTFTPGCARSKSATTPLIALSSRAVKPTHSVTVAGASGFSAVPAAAGGDDAARAGGGGGRRRGRAGGGRGRGRGRGARATAAARGRDERRRDERHGRQRRGPRGPFGRLPAAGHCASLLPRRAGLP